MKEEPEAAEGKTASALADNSFPAHHPCRVPLPILFQFPLLILYLRLNPGPHHRFQHRRYLHPLPGLRFPLPLLLARAAEESVPFVEAEASAWVG